MSIFITFEDFNKLIQQKENIIIFDAIFFLPNSGMNAENEYKKEHIPNTIFFDINKICDPDQSLPHMFPNKTTFTNMKQNLGLNKDHQVIIYDNSPLLTSARCWFLLRYFGHKKINIFQGGIKNWKNNGGKTNQLEVKKNRGNFVSSEKKPELLIKLSEMKKISKNKLFKIFDARSLGRFIGKEQEPRPGLPSGHIPNSSSLPSSKLINEENELIGNNEIKNILLNKNIKNDEKIIATCGSGVSACVIALAFYCLGNERVSIYDGSWTEWASKKQEIKTI